MKEEWTDKLKDRLEDFSQPVPEDLWAGIEHSLKVRRSPLRFVAPLLAGIAAVAASVYILIPNHSDTTPVIDVVETVPQVTADLYTPEPSDDEPTTVMAVAKQASVKMPTAAMQLDEPMLASMPEDDGCETKDADEREPAKSADNVVQNTEIIDFPIFEDDMQTASSNRRSLSFGMQMGSTSANTTSNAAHPFMTKSATYGSLLAFDPEGWKTVETMSAGDYDWSVSLQASAQVRAYLTDRFSISSGISLTLLEGKQDFIQNRQTAGYIGIPLNLNYDFLHVGDLHLGINAGGSASYCVLKPDGLGINKWQMAASAGINALYKFGRRTGLQAGIGSETFLAAPGTRTGMFSKTTTLMKADLGLVWLLF